MSLRSSPIYLLNHTVSYWPWGKGDALGEGRRKEAGKKVELSCLGPVWRQFWARVEIYSHSLCVAHQSLCHMLKTEPIDLDLMEFGGVTLEVIRVG